MTDILHGFAQDRGGGRADLGHGEISALARQGRVAYRVLPAVSAARSGERRASRRRRSRLRSAKLLDSNNRFLCECLVHDYSTAGLRLTLMKNIGLPSRCVVFDDETGDAKAVAVVWRRGSLVGMRYRWNDRPAQLSSVARAALRGRYYAMAD
jgi:hypothetical protein